MDEKESLTTENSCGGSADMCSHPTPPAPKPAAAPTTSAATAAAAPAELHACMGLNACKGHDRFGTNSCAGTGYCATAERHNCKSLNNCRGQGGCGLYGTAEDDATPGANECAWQGSCAVPIQAERYSTQGENKGKSVWVLARKLFEERMKKANRTYGPSPYECGPPQAWLVQSLGSYDSCGSAGNKYCTFGFNDPAKDAKELCERSLHHVICGSARQTESASAATEVSCKGSPQAEVSCKGSPQEA
ncbi:MAG TPA: hypothetical protein VGX48_02540 [Pyrinomonadaceae bacterium]|jgi:hypothetical protein|nr:hypothetical protein [Pyrinomonadaceae bacterium]